MVQSARNDDRRTGRPLELDPTDERVRPSEDYEYEDKVPATTEDVEDAEIDEELRHLTQAERDALGNSPVNPTAAAGLVNPDEDAQEGEVIAMDQALNEHGI